MLIEHRNLADTRVLIIWPNGPHSLGFMLKPFLQKQRREESVSFTYIGHPIPLRQSLFRESECLIATGTMAPKRIVLPRKGYVGLASLLTDWGLTTLFLAMVRRRHDVCMTMGLHYNLMGIILKKLGVTKQSVIVFEEYRSLMYKKAFMRRLYRQGTVWCCKQADLIVYTTSLIRTALANDGIEIDPSKQMLVPLPLDHSEFGSRPREEIVPDSILWAGQLTDDYGFELVIDAIELVAKSKPTIRVTVMSYTPLPDYLKKKMQDRGLDNYFHMLGFIKDEDEFRNNIRQHRVALALYRPADTVKKHADVIRPWVYMANGVPHIINRLPAVAAKIEEAGAGIVIDYDKKQLADAILTLLTDDSLHESCRQNGLKMAESRDSVPIFTSLFNRLRIHIDNMPNSGCHPPT